jgi:3-methylfumaryl-CoA hydratase
MGIDIVTLRGWIGRTETRSEVLDPAPARRLAATLDAPETDWREGMALPPLFHWLYFLPACRHSDLAEDGHPARGTFLPPVPLPRRMWAASAIEFLAPVAFGETVVRTTEILDVALKEGRSGPLIFVKLKHALVNAAGRTALVEMQDLVYRNPPSAADAGSHSIPAAQSARWIRQVTPDAQLLFRYSALTFNSHRIHYDRPYAVDVEGYAGLVVQGPLLATLLADHLLREMPSVRFRHFAFRAERPLFDGAPVFLCARPSPDPLGVQLWSCDAAGVRHTQAFVTLQAPSV